MGAYKFQKCKIWTKYLNTKVGLKTWTSQFSSSKCWKTRKPILLTISMPGIGARKMQTHFTSSNSVNTWTQHKNTKNDFQVSKVEKQDRQFF